MTTATSDHSRKGGSWLLEDTPQADVFTPEKLTDEHRLMAKTTAEFIANEVVPSLERLEAKDWELARSLIRRSGELGLLGIAVPEEYGGLDLDKASSLAVVEQIGTVGVVLHDIRRAGQSDASCRSCSSAHAAQKSEVPAATGRW